MYSGELLVWQVEVNCRDLNSHTCLFPSWGGVKTVLTVNHKKMSSVSGILLTCLPYPIVLKKNILLLNTKN